MTQAHATKDEAKQAPAAEPAARGQELAASARQQDESLEVARRVLRIEADALAQAADALNGEFVRAVETILAINGRVVVSGMGKSGHIGRKIAATLASTGTPAQFVHPAEAAHGDLGMVTTSDVALVLSNSGETPELMSIIEHARRYEIPLIGMATRLDSTLMRAADIKIPLPPAPEACAMGLAPTTSTTLTLGIGDALAVALMERRNFTPENFRAFHPGGKLGAKLLKVENLMHGRDRLPLVSQGTAMSEAILEITSKSFGVVGVLDAQGGLIGVVSDGDLRRNLDALFELKVEEVASSEPKTIGPDALAGEAVALMNRHKITSLFVVDPQEADARKPVGLIHIHDCLRAGVV